ncbi:TPA: 50S ribosomal protein L29 [Candidatus Woesearchaeota archaeon]|nr:50S ribosomal protein L29 [Candidatus Woesearchaeota archaeon]
MKAMKLLTSLSVVELRSRLEELQKELLKLTVHIASGANTKNPGKIRQTKKTIARIKFLLGTKGEGI